MSVFNGKCLFLDSMPTTDVQTGACSYGAGAYFHGDWLFHSFVMDKPEIRDLHINYKEIIAIVFAAKHWGHLWGSKHIILSDSTSVSIINKGTTKNSSIMSYSRESFLLSALCNFCITAVHITGHMNYIADAILCLHEASYLLKVFYFLQSHYGLLLFNWLLLLHMSVYSWNFLFLGTLDAILAKDLQNEVLYYQSHTFSENTKHTYKSHIDSSARFCLFYEHTSYPINHFQYWLVCCICCQIFKTRFCQTIC